MPVPVVPSAALTASVNVAVSVVVPEVPVTVMVENPVAAEEIALSVTFRVFPCPVNVARTPFGRPDAANVTLPVKPPMSLMVIAALAVEL